MFYCPTCGGSVQQGDSCCNNCGTAFDWSGSVNREVSENNREVLSGSGEVQATINAFGTDQKAAGGNGVSADGAFTTPGQKRGRPKFSAIAAATVAVVALVTLLGIGWFGFGPVQPKGSVEAYSWDELSKISKEIARAPNESEAVRIAKRYNLCTNDGRLDGTQVKSLKLSNGEKASVQIVGFAHDEKSNGGKAGITFMFSDPVAAGGVNDSSTNYGGWKDCQLRKQLNKQGIDLLPNDLSKHIVAVNKLTNNAGEAQSASSVSTTSDKLWLFSFVELYGPLGPGGEAIGEVLDAEGSEYKLFRDMATRALYPNQILIKSLGGEFAAPWWFRSPVPITDGSFFVSVDDGSFYGYPSNYSFYGVVPGFCI